MSKTILEQAREIRAAMDAAGSALTDEQAFTCKMLFPEWSVKAYAAGDKVRYGGQLYKCVQAHTAQADWTPDTAASLWARMDDPAEEWPLWVQPLGSTDAYAAGAKVTHNGSHWTSDLDANVWEPGVYGWTEVSGG